MNDNDCDIHIHVDTSYMDDQSEPDADRYVFAYTITISNHGDVPATLVGRHWVITDANGEVEEVVGPGVVGEQPVLAPGEAFEYTSFCPLPTPFGTMRGSYRMVTESGDDFDVEIAEFELSQPLTLN